MRVAFAGTPEFALPALAALIEHTEVVGVLTQPDRPKGRGRKLSASAVKSAALTAQLPLAQPQSLNEPGARAVLAAWRPDALVVVAYGLILPREVLGLPPLGCINIHASLLPRWRGAAPVQRAILAGDAETGVTIMQMDAGLDTGPVLLQRRLAISGSHTAATLQAELATIGAAALLEALRGLAAGSLGGRPQPPEGVTYAAKLEKSEARINWSDDAAVIERQVRAFNPWPVAETTLSGEPLKILMAHPEPAAGNDIPDVGDKSRENASKSIDPGAILAIEGDFIRVQCGRGCLRVLEVQRPGRRAMAARDFAHGVGLLGQRLG